MGTVRGLCGGSRSYLRGHGSAERQGRLLAHLRSMVWILEEGFPHLGVDGQACVCCGTPDCRQDGWRQKWVAVPGRFLVERLPDHFLRPEGRKETLRLPWQPDSLRVAGLRPGARRRGFSERDQRSRKWFATS